MPILALEDQLLERLAPEVVAADEDRGGIEGKRQTPGCAAARRSHPTRSSRPETTEASTFGLRHGGRDLGGSAACGGKPRCRAARAAAPGR